MSSDPLLVLSGVHKRFEMAGGPLTALSGIDLTVARGETLVLVGESGCGKSTLLRLMAGLEKPSEGRVLFDGRLVTGPALERGMVFQEPRLFPWMTVEGNVAFGLPEGADPGGKVDEIVGWTGLKGFEKAYPSQLSGGMRQRAALARTLVSRPRLLLMDEPFGALDALTRIRMQEETLRLKEREKATLVLVTHDIDEAVFLGDRVVVLSPRPGRVKRVFSVPLSHPRDRNGAALVRIRARIYDEFFRKPSRPRRRSRT
ncbi:MAG TPA: ABC transporter ATP-binding protein [bacterium]|nr:ABC transporter ATP-binding protein [bacterium]